LIIGLLNKLEDSLSQKLFFILAFIISLTENGDEDSSQYVEFYIDRSTGIRWNVDRTKAEFIYSCLRLHHSDLDEDESSYYQEGYLIKKLSQGNNYVNIDDDDAQSSMVYLTAKVLIDSHSNLLANLTQDKPLTVQSLKETVLLSVTRTIIGNECPNLDELGASTSILGKVTRSPVRPNAHKDSTSSANVDSTKVLEIKKIILFLLVHLSYMDGSLGDSEKVVLDEVVKIFGLDSDLLDEMAEIAEVISKKTKQVKDIITI
jgi:hypothetical protein